MREADYFATNSHLIYGLSKGPACGMWRKIDIQVHVEGVIARALHCYTGLALLLRNFQCHSGVEGDTINNA